MTLSSAGADDQGPEGGPGRDERFRKSERLRKRPQFLHARNDGWRSEGDWVVIYAVANDVGHPRLGVTVSTRVGNAVVRNRYKRRLREIFRRGKHHFGGGYDVVVIVKSRPEDPSFDELRDDVYQTARRAVQSYRDRREGGD